MKCIDSHAHITPRWFKNPRNVIESSKESLEGLVLIGLDPEEYHYLLDVVNTEPNFVKIAFGFSPSYIHKIDAEQFLQEIEQKIQETHQVHAIGEIGLDFYRVREKTLHAKQEDFFLRGIQLANTQNLPLTIHSRAAEARTVELLSQHAETEVVLHCFGGGDQVSLACDNGFYVSIPTAVTYRREFQEVARKTPLDHMLIETDSPFLSPIRGKRQNTPKNVEYAAKEIAKIQGLPIADIVGATTKNAQSIFWKTP